MNLAFVDPGPSKLAFYLSLRSYLAPHLRCFYFSHHSDIRKLIRAAGSEVYPLAGSPSPPSYDIDDEALRTAIGGKELFLREQQALASARQLLADIDAFLDACDADALLVWNGSDLQLSLAIYLARQRGLPVLFMEHGYLPGTVQLDLQGVNYFSSITQAVQAGKAQLDFSRDVDTALDHAIAGFKAGRPTRTVDPRLKPQLQTNPLALTYQRCRLTIKQTYRRRLWREGRALGLDSSAPLPERFILVPMQVGKDSQLILHSPLVGNDPWRLLRLVQEAVRATDPRLRIVAKLHPREKLPVQRRNLKLLRDFPDVRFMSDVSMRDLLARAAAVVTINSTAGFEAFFYDKPVITLGRNFYTSPDLVEVVQAEDELIGALQRALVNPVPSKRRRAFLRYVYARCFVQASYDDCSERSLRAAARRIRELLSTARPSRLSEAIVA